MNRFQAQLAAFESYMAAAEPRLAPAVSDIIDKHYRTRVNFGDSSPTIDSLTAAGLWADIPNDQAAAQADATAGSQTTGILTNLLSTAGNLIQNDQATQQQLQKLQAAATVQQAQAAGAAYNKSTMLLIGGSIAAIALVALVAGSGQGGRR